MGKTARRAATILAGERIQGIKVRRCQPTQAERDKFLEILNDANDEAPAQTFFLEHPSFLIRMLPPGAKIIVFDRPKLGSEYIPDFLITLTNSPAGLIAFPLGLVGSADCLPPPS